jgi:hypothetical protein
MNSAGVSIFIGYDDESMVIIGSIVYWSTTYYQIFHLGFSTKTNTGRKTLSSEQLSQY